MSECVVRMKNPDDCLKCGVRHICNLYVDYWQQDTRKKPKPGQKGCLIICQLHEGHGRLVDAEEDVGNYITIWDCNCSEFGRQTVMAVEDLQYLPTIVPAEPKEDA